MASDTYLQALSSARPMMADVLAYIMLVAHLLLGGNKNSSTEKYAVLQMKVPAITADQRGNTCPGLDSLNRSDAGWDFPVAAGVFGERMRSTGKFVKFAVQMEQPPLPGDT